MASKEQKKQWRKELYILLEIMARETGESEQDESQERVKNWDVTCQESLSVTKKKKENGRKKFKN